MILKFFEFLGRFFTYPLLGLSGFLIISMALLSTFGVVMRYFLKTPEPYSYELTTMFLLFSGVLAFSGVEKMNRHITNDLIASYLPKGVRLVHAHLLFPVLASVFSFVLLWKSMKDAFYALQIGQRSNSEWGEPLWPIKFVISGGYLLLSLVLLGKVYEGVAWLGRLLKRSR